MEEYNYSILYRINYLNEDKTKMSYTPCYLVKGFYDGDTFLDLVNKSRYTMDDVRNITENKVYCVGNVYTENELYKRFYDARSFEDLMVKFYQNAEQEIVTGVYNKEYNVITIIGDMYDDSASLEEDSDIIEKDTLDVVDNHEEDNIETTDYYYEKVKKELGYDVVIIPFSVIENLRYLEVRQLENYFSYIKHSQNDYCKKRLSGEYEKSIIVSIDDYEKLCLKGQYIQLRDFLISSLEDAKNMKKDFTYDDLKEVINNFNDLILDSRDIVTLRENLSGLLQLNIQMLNVFIELEKKGKNCHNSVKYFYKQKLELEKIVKYNNMTKIQAEYVDLSLDTKKDLRNLKKEIDSIQQDSFKESSSATDDILKIEEDNDMYVKVDKTLESLDKLVGLKEAKETINGMLSTIIYMKKTEDSLKFEKESKNLAFVGNPGTGKTTMAGIIAPLLYQLGYIENNNVAYISTEDLIAGYVGQTALKTKELINKNKGGIIILDEAYNLANDSGKFSNDAVGVLVKEMEKNRTMFIFAGYEKEMKNFISMNSGLKSRISTYVKFNDFTEEELFEIFMKTVDDTAKNKNQDYKLRLTEGAINKVKEIIHDAKQIKDFGNARFIKNVFNVIKREHAKNTKYSDDISELYLINENDIPDDILTLIFNYEDKEPIGFSQKVIKKSKLYR